jgi:hypothetical protein
LAFELEFLQTKIEILNNGVDKLHVPRRICVPLPGHVKLNSIKILINRGKIHADLQRA